jgi:hypothetical protein
MPRKNESLGMLSLSLCSCITRSGCRRSGPRAARQQTSSSRRLGPLPRLACQQYTHAAVCKSPSFFFQILVLSSEVLSVHRFESNNIRIFFSSSSSSSRDIRATRLVCSSLSSFLLIFLGSSGAMPSSSFYSSPFVSCRYCPRSGGTYLKHFCGNPVSLGCFRPIDIKIRMAASSSLSLFVIARSKFGMKLDRRSCSYNSPS